jgi:hypothetical protein
MAINPEQILDVESEPSTKSSTGFKDPNGIYPKKDNIGLSNVAPQALHGGETVELQGRNGFVYIENFGEEAEATKNYHQRTPAGHVIERNDTSENERILIKHAKGDALINMCPGGEIVVKSKSRVDVINGDHEFSAYNGKITYNGNLELEVKGDYIVNVQGEYKVTSQDRTETVYGPFKSTVYGNKSDIIEGNVARQVTGTTTQTSLTGYNNIVKGPSRHVVQGNMSHNASGTMDITANDQIDIATQNLNQSAKSLSVFGSTGTIGGENIIMYNYNMYTGHSISAGDTVSTTTVIASETMTSKEFIGSLTGNADTATEAGRAGTAGALGASGSAGTKVTGTAAAVDTTATALPTPANVANYLTKYAIKRVEVDPSDVILGYINLSTKQGGVTNTALNAKGTRMRMCDPAHRANSSFTSYNIAQGNLSSDHVKTTPPEVGRIRSAKELVVKGSTPIGNIQPEGSAIRLIRSVAPVRDALLPVSIQASISQGITSLTQLTKDIRIGKFLAAEAFQATLPQITFDKQQLARNLGHFANIVQAFNENVEDFSGYELHVVEGVYVPYKDESYTPDGPLDLARQGRRIAVEVRDEDGVDLEKTFEAATWLTANTAFGELTLDYDTYEGADKLNARIVLTIDSIPENFVQTFDKKVKTAYNNAVQVTNEIMEILQA